MRRYILRSSNQRKIINTNSYSTRKFCFIIHLCKYNQRGNGPRRYCFGQLFAQPYVTLAIKDYLSALSLAMIALDDRFDHGEYQHYARQFI